MARIVGQLEGANGPLSGRLFVKAGGAFIGAPNKELVFKIEDGIVDIELPPCPSSMPYAVDWREIGDTRRLSYVERWQVRPVEEMGLDEARGLVRGDNGGRVSSGGRKGSLIEATMLRNELRETQEKLAALEEDHAGLLRRLSQAESKAAAAQGESASLYASLMKAQQQLTRSNAPQVVEKERIVERVQSRQESVQEKAELIQAIELLKQENQELLNRANDAVGLNTHFANLHAEIDRLSNEKQMLLRRIEELKRPVRNSSALRNEAIANLDRLIN